MPFQQITRSSAADLVRDQVLALIESGGLAVGSKLPSEHELARSFGVSRPVVREGLGALRAAGVLESRSGLGTFVKALRPAGRGLLLLGQYAPADLHEVRSHLEIPGAGVAAVRRSDAHLRRLDEIVSRHAGRTSASEWVDDDVAFHVTLAEATGNALHARLIAELRELQVEQTIVMAELGGGLGAPEDEHRAIVEAVRRRDAAAAREAMAAHLEAIRARLIIVDQQQGGADGNAP